MGTQSPDSTATSTYSHPSSSFPSSALRLEETVYKETPNHPELAGTINDLAGVHEALGRLSEAAEGYERALRMLRAAQADNLGDEEESEEVLTTSKSLMRVRAELAKGPPKPSKPAAPKPGQMPSRMSEALQRKKEKEATSPATSPERPCPPPAAATPAPTAAAVDDDDDDDAVLLPALAIGVTVAAIAVFALSRLVLPARWR